MTQEDSILIAELTKSTGSARVKRQIGPDSNLDCYQKRVLDCNYREATQIAESRQVHPLQKIRSALSSGNLKQARELISSIKFGDLSTEVLFEEFRLLFQSGKPEEAIILGRFLLGNEAELNPLTLLSLNQSLAVCFFELGLTSESESSLARCDALLPLFPNAQSHFYCEATRIKLMYQTHPLEKSRLELDRAWQMVAANPDLDRILTLVRLEVDWRKKSLLPFRSWAWLSFILADQMGDGVYAGLSLLDLSITGELPKNLKLKLKKSILQHGRVKRLNRETYDSEPKLISAAWNQTYLGNTRKAEFAPQKEISLAISTDLKMIIDLKNESVRFFPPSEKLFSALNILGNGPMSKSDFFIQCWGHKKFNYKLHDSVIRSLVYRVKKELGIQIAPSQGMLELEETLVLDIKEMAK